MDEANTPKPDRPGRVSRTIQSRWGAILLFVLCGVAVWLLGNPLPLFLELWWVLSGAAAIGIAMGWWQAAAFRSNKPFRERRQ